MQVRYHPRMSESVSDKGRARSPPARLPAGWPGIASRSGRTHQRPFLGRCSGGLRRQHGARRPGKRPPKFGRHRKMRIETRLGSPPRWGCRSSLPSAREIVSQFRLTGELRRRRARRVKLRATFDLSKFGLSVAFPMPADAKGGKGVRLCGSFGSYDLCRCQPPDFLHQLPMPDMPPLGGIGFSPSGVSRQPSTTLPVRNSPSTPLAA
jgi:hypothetical protein